MSERRFFRRFFIVLGVDRSPQLAARLVEGNLLHLRRLLRLRVDAFNFLLFAFDVAVSAGDLRLQGFLLGLHAADGIGAGLGRGQRGIRSQQSLHKAW